MKFCKQCGNQLKDEDLFCANCGRPVDGTVKENINEKPAQNLDIQILNEHLKQIKDVYLGMTVKPLSTIKYVSITMKVQAAVILTVFLGIISGLLNMWFVKQFTSYIQNGAGLSNGHFNLAGIINSIFQSIYSLIGNKVSYGAIFSYSIIASILLILLLGVLIFLIGRYIAKFHIKFEESLNIVAAGTIPIINYYILYLILSNINSILGHAFFAAGIIMYILCIFNGVKEIFEDMEDNAAFTVAASFILFYIITNVALRIIIDARLSMFTQL